MSPSKEVKTPQHDGTPRSHHLFGRLKHVLDRQPVASPLQRVASHRDDDALRRDRRRGVVTEQADRAPRAPCQSREHGAFLSVLSQMNAGFLLESVRLQQRLQTGMNRVLQATTGRVCTASPAALKWLKREQLLKLLKSRRARAPVAAPTACDPRTACSFQTRPATQRVSAKEAQRHCKHPLCDGAVRTGCPPCVA